jgi:hypothetical protein
MQVKFVSGGAHRHRGGIVHRAPEARRPLPVRRAHPRIRPRARDDGVREPRHRQPRRRAALAGRQDAAVVRTGAGRAVGAGRCRRRPFRRSGDARRRTAAAAAGALVASADARPAGGRAFSQPRGRTPAAVSVRRPFRARRPGFAARLPPEPGGAGDVLDGRQRLRARTAVADRSRPGRAISRKGHWPGRRCFPPTSCSRTCWRA